MDVQHHSRGGIRPRFALTFAPRINEGAGKAGCQPHPMASYAKGSQSYEHCSHHRSAGHPAFPARRTLRLMPDLLGSARGVARHHSVCLAAPSGRTAFNAWLGAVRQHISVWPYAFCSGHHARRRLIASYGIGYPAPATRPTCPRQSAFIVIRSTQAMMANAPRRPERFGLYAR